MEQGRVGMGKACRPWEWCVPLGDEFLGDHHDVLRFTLNNL